MHTENRLIFSGFQQSYMYYNTVAKSWIIQSLREKRNALHQPMKRDSPIGRIEYNHEVEDKDDSCDEKTNKRVLLTFTSCEDGEFTCDSGHCVDDLGYILTIFKCDTYISMRI